MTIWSRTSRRYRCDFINSFYLCMNHNYPWQEMYLLISYQSSLLHSPPKIIAEGRVGCMRSNQSSNDIPAIRSIIIRIMQADGSAEEPDICSPVDWWKCSMVHDCRPKESIADGWKKRKKSKSSNLSYIHDPSSCLSLMPIAARKISLSAGHSRCNTISPYDDMMTRNVSSMSMIPIRKKRTIEVIRCR